jgi:hypothetical protein
VTESTYQYIDSLPRDPVRESTPPLSYDQLLANRWDRLDAWHSEVLAGLPAACARDYENPYGWTRSELARFLAAHMQRQAQWIPAAESRNHARQQLADYLEAVVLTSQFCDPWQAKVRTMVERLRLARGWAELKYDPVQQRWLTVWEAKADLPLLCPDDANEEFQRLKRRYLGKLLEWVESGGRIYSMVLTAPHAAPGSLHDMMRERFTGTQQLLKKLAPVKGSLVVMECPLSARRKWNVHVNVLVLASGYLHYADVRRYWQHNLHITELGSDAELLASSLRELVKYAVRTTPDKSMDESKRAKAIAEGRVPAPAMVEWSASEWLEWWRAHRGFRRTRTSGVLYKVGKPPPQDLDGFIPVGQVVRQGGEYFVRLPLLSSIQWDNFSRAHPRGPESGNPGGARGANQRARGPPD